MTTKKFLYVIFAGLVLGVMICSLPALAGDETTTDAEVQVLPPDDYSYGFKVIRDRNVWIPMWSLEKPDNRGAYILFGGWINIELKNKVTYTDTISIWAANHGWSDSHVKIYVSADGRKWKPAGQVKITTEYFQKYDFTGNFRTIEYIKVDRSGNPFSWLRLDAVGAKGGDK